MLGLVNSTYGENFDRDADDDHSNERSRRTRWTFGPDDFPDFDSIDILKKSLFTISVPADSSHNFGIAKVVCLGIPGNYSVEILHEGEVIDSFQGKDSWWEDQRPETRVIGILGGRTEIRFKDGSPPVGKFSFKVRGYWKQIA